MTRNIPNGHAIGSDADWAPVSSQRPCAVCGAGDGCHTHVEEPLARCSRSHSDWPLTNGDWLHRTPPATCRNPQAA
jgi:hypothetical protein